MANFVRKSLMAKLLGFFLLVALVPIVLVGSQSYRTARDALNTAEYRKLDALRDQISMGVHLYVVGCFHAARFLADYDRVEAALATFPVMKPEADKTSLQSQETPSEQNQVDIRARLDRFMEHYLEFEQTRLAYRDVIIVRPDGYVIYTAKDGGEFGENLGTGKLRDTGLAKAFRQVQSSQKATMVDFGMYEPVKAPSAFIGVPVFSRKDRRLTGVLMMRIGLDGLNRLAKLTKSAGDTAKTYIVRSDGIMLTEPRVQRETAPLSLKVENAAVTAALKDQTGEMVTTDYRGVQTLCSFSHLGLNENSDLGVGFDWALFVEIDVSEAIQPAEALAYRILMIALVIAVAVGVLGVYLARSISRPMSALGGAAARVGKGDLHVEVPELKRHDEMGALARTFRTMVQSLGDQIRRVTEGMSVLSSAASEISATVSQVASSMSQTSSAVTETTTTVAQVKQAARVVQRKSQECCQGVQRGR